MIAREGPLVEKFKGEIIQRYESQASVLANRQLYLDSVTKCTKKEACLNGKYCAALFDEISSQKKCPYEVFESMELILPDVELPM